MPRTNVAGLEFKLNKNQLSLLDGAAAQSASFHIGTRDSDGNFTEQLQSLDTLDWISDLQTLRGFRDGTQYILYQNGTFNYGDVIWFLASQPTLLTAWGNYFDVCTAYLNNPSITQSGTEIRISSAAHDYIDYYQVYLNDESYIQVAPAAITAFTDTVSGPHFYTCRAISNAIDIASSGYSNKLMLNVTQLDAPVITGALESGQYHITWAGVANATIYKIYKDGVEYDNIPATLTYYDTVVAGSYKVKAVAYLYTDSDFSNTVTFAPSQLSAPTISISGSNITWSAVTNATGYDVYKGGTKIGTTANLFYTVSEIGTYTVKATASGYTDSDASNAVTYQAKLDTPDIGISAGILGWSTVTHATSYDIYKNGAKLLNQAGNSYTLTDPGVYYVIAKASGYIDSDPSESVVYSVRLTAPVLTLGKGVLTWTAPANAESYKLYLGGTQIRTVNDTQISLVGFEKGSYTVIAQASGYADSPTSNAVSFNGTAGTPVITLTGSRISWSATDNTTSYGIFKDGVQITTVTTLYYDLTLSGTYTVKALNATGIDSALSNSVIYVRALSAPLVDLDGNRLIWSAVPNATLYKIYRDNNLIAASEFPGFLISESGKYQVKSTAAGYPDSGFSNMVVVGTGLIYQVTDDDLNDIANAIRYKNGGTANLAFPIDFITAIKNL